MERVVVFLHAHSIFYVLSEVVLDSAYWLPLKPGASEMV